MNSPRFPSRRRGQLRLGLIILLVLALAAGLAWWLVEGKGEAAREAEREKPVAVPQRLVSEGGRTVVKLDAATQQRNGIQTTVLSAAGDRQPVRAFASVLDAARLTDLSNSYLSSQSQLAAARAKVAASKASFDRAQLLYRDAQNMSLAQMQAAEAAYRADQASLAAAEAQVQTTLATAGQEFGPALRLGSPLATSLVQRRLVLLQVTAPPGVAIASPPRTIPIQNDAGVRVQARLVSPAVKTDPKIQGYSFYYVTPAASGLLPGMNVLALLPGGAGVTGVAVPNSAVVSWLGRSWIYRRIEPQAFERLEISTSLPAAGGGYLVQSLAPGTAVVTRGAQLLLSEEMRSSGPASEEKD